MSEPGYYRLDDFVYYGDSLRNIKPFTWFNTFPFEDKKQFVYVLRSAITEENLRYMLMDIYPKIFSVNVEAVGVMDEQDIRPYIITFVLHYDNFWDDVVDKLFLYCMAFLNTMDFHVLSSRQPKFNSFEDNFMLALELGDYTIVPEQFFDSSMARLLVSIQKNSKSDFIPLLGSINTDIQGIKTILSSPRDLRKVLRKVPRMNCTTISEEISNEYAQFRRTL